MADVAASPGVSFGKIDAEVVVITGVESWISAASETATPPVFCVCNIFVPEGAIKIIGGISLAVDDAGTLDFTAVVFMADVVDVDVFLLTAIELVFAGEDEAY